MLVGDFGLIPRPAEHLRGRDLKPGHAGMMFEQSQDGRLLRLTAPSQSTTRSRRDDRSGPGCNNCLIIAAIQTSHLRQPRPCIQVGWIEL